MKNKVSDEIRLLHILDSIRKISSFVKGVDEKVFSKTDIIQSAVERQLEIIGEAIAGISDVLKDKHPEIEWIKIKGFRNIIAHEYFGVSKKQIWLVVVNELPVLRKQIKKIMKEFKVL